MPNINVLWTPVELVHLLKRDNNSQDLKVGVPQTGVQPLWEGFLIPLYVEIYP